MHSVLPVRPRFKQTHFGRSLYFSWMDTTRISACHCKTIDFLRLPATVIMFGTRKLSFNELIELTWWTMRFPVFVLLSMACWLQWIPVSRVLKPTFVSNILPNCLGAKWSSCKGWHPLCFGGLQCCLQRDQRHDHFWAWLSARWPKIFLSQLYSFLRTLINNLLLSKLVMIFSPNSTHGQKRLACQLLWHGCVMDWQGQTRIL